MVDIFLVAYLVVEMLYRPGIPSRRELDEHLARASRAQSYLLSILSAVALGFMISLASSYVHDGFESSLARQLGRFEEFHLFGLLGGWCSLLFS